MSIWDEFESGGNYVEFKVVGDTFSGKILNIGAKTWPAENGKPARTTPQLQMLGDDGEEWTLTAGWALLIAALKKEAPNVGDHLQITLTGIGPKPKETKEWRLVATKGGAPTPTPPGVAASAPAATSEASALTPEQIAALAAASAPAAPAWDADPRVASLRAMGIGDAAIRTTLGI